MIRALMKVGVAQRRGWCTVWAAAALVVIIGGIGAQAAGSESIVSVGSLAMQEMDVARLPLLTRNRVDLQSSFDRSGGNKDFANYVSGDDRSGILVDREGPGAITRIWSANPRGRIKIYIDNSVVPCIDAPFPALFDNSLPPFNTPLSGTSSGGFFTYLPIPYAHHCKVVLENGANVYYQVNTLSFAPGTAVRSFALPLPSDDQTALDSAGAAWSGLEQQVASGARPAARLRIVPGKTVSLGDYAGPSRIRKITFSCTDASDADLRRIVLRAYFDGHKAADIEAPVADFFGNAYGRKPYRTFLLSCAPDGTLEADFPMPFARRAHFTLESGASKPLQVGWQVEVEKQPFHPLEEGYFHAIWTQELTRTGHAHVWAHIAGQRGKWLGVVQTIQSSHGTGFIEGDDQYRVDDQRWMSSSVKTTVVAPGNGTGTEDGFNSGWGFQTGPNALPMNALLAKDDYQGIINCQRWFVNDAPVFQTSLDTQIEHGAGNSTPGVYYSSVAYWYSNGAVNPWFAMPAASQLALPPRRVALNIPGAVEGESLIGSATASGGNVASQNMDPFDGDWSSHEQLIWFGSKAGDMLTLPLSVPAGGVYDLTGYFTRATDYGQVSFSINGTPLEATLDGYAASVVPSGPIHLGSVTLPAGRSNFVVTLTGKNALSQGTLFGLDAIKLDSRQNAP